MKTKISDYGKAADSIEKALSDSRKSYLAYLRAQFLLPYILKSWFEKKDPTDNKQINKALEFLEKGEVGKLDDASIATKNGFKDQLNKALKVLGIEFGLTKESFRGSAFHLVAIVGNRWGKEEESYILAKSPYNTASQVLNNCVQRTIKHSGGRIPPRDYGKHPDEGISVGHFDYDRMTEGVRRALVTSSRFRQMVSNAFNLEIEPPSIKDRAFAHGDGAVERVNEIVGWGKKKLGIGKLIK